MFSCQNEGAETITDTPPVGFNVDDIQMEDGVRSFLSISDIHLDIDSDTITPHGHGYTDNPYHSSMIASAWLAHCVSEVEPQGYPFLAPWLEHF